MGILHDTASSVGRAFSGTRASHDQLVSRKLSLTEVPRLEVPA